MKIDNGIREIYNSETALMRQDLYIGATRKLKKANENGYWIEAISICESILCDRLEARISHLNRHTELARRHGTLGSLIKRLRSTEKIQGQENLHDIYNRIKNWSLLRNKAVHGAVKLTQGQEFLPFEKRYALLQAVAIDGRKLFNELKNEHDKIKRKNMKVAARTNQ